MKDWGSRRVLALLGFHSERIYWFSWGLVEARQLLDDVLCLISMKSHYSARHLLKQIFSWLLWKFPSVFDFIPCMFGHQQCISFFVFSFFFSFLSFLFKFNSQTIKTSEKQRGNAVATSGFVEMSGRGGFKSLEETWRPQFSSCRI